jgi:hypothetical protein
MFSKVFWEDEKKGGEGGDKGGDKGDDKKSDNGEIEDIRRQSVIKISSFTGI